MKISVLDYFNKIIDNKSEFDKEAISIAEMKEDLVNFKSKLYNILYNIFSSSFNIKDIKFSGYTVVVFWDDNTKTKVTMDKTEKEYDFEKALFAAYTKKAISFVGKNSKDRRIDNILKKWYPKYEENKKDIEKQMDKIDKRKLKKQSESK